jgi:Asp/Glu/hydantoin racemase
VHRKPRIAVIGPTSMTWDEIAEDVAPDLERLRGYGLEVDYVVTGGGPRSITTDEDERAAAPFVVTTAERCERDGFDAVIVDCTGDPGVAAARHRLRIPVVGAGEAVRRAAAGAPPPVVVLSGDELRASDEGALLARAQQARTVVLGGTGWSRLVPLLAVDGRIVLDPLDVALEQCLALIADQAG